MISVSRRSSLEAAVDRRERDADVEHPENGAVRRVRVATGRGTTGLVVDRRHHAQHAVPLVLEHATARGHVEPFERPVGRVARVAGLGGLVDERAALATVRGEGDLAFLVEEADPLDVLLPADALHGEVGVATPILEHRVVRAVLDRVAQQCGVAGHAVDQRTFLHPEDEPGQQGDRSRGAEDDGRREPDAKPAPPGHWQVLPGGGCPARGMQRELPLWNCRDLQRSRGFAGDAPDSRRISAGSGGLGVRVTGRRADRRADLQVRRVPEMPVGGRRSSAWLRAARPLGLARGP